jgi:CRISPR-associated protein Cmr2
MLHPKPNGSFTLPGSTVDMLHRLIRYEVDINRYPRYTLYLQFEFTLARPYISKDDIAVYIEENPIRKETIFKVPMISASGWKGNLRSALRQCLGPNSDTDPRLTSLFGNSRNVDADFRSGRLTFFPTFFDAIALEVFNPHSRKRRAGTKPIFFEVIPAGRRGIFRLFYFPFDAVGRPDMKTIVAGDLMNIANSVLDMALRSGFSAKKSLDYGVMDEIIEGNVNISRVGLPGIAADSGDRFHSFKEFKNAIEMISTEVLTNG